MTQRDRAKSNVGDVERVQNFQQETINALTVDDDDDRSSLCKGFSGSLYTAPDPAHVKTNVVFNGTYIHRIINVTASYRAMYSL